MHEWGTGVAKAHVVCPCSTKMPRVFHSLVCMNSLLRASCNMFISTGLVSTKVFCNFQRKQRDEAGFHSSPHKVYIKPGVAGAHTYSPTSHRPSQKTKERWRSARVRVTHTDAQGCQSGRKKVLIRSACESRDMREFESSLI